ncbi:Tex-like N-terminal domain-containing protein, partial [Arthrobacter sp. 4R501]|uniref:Tex-like N-terminal domain-containing protein n=1 Tax=Arthrobacter sp. 4R501 TaxID=2058886 RepID=UPI0011AFFEA4
MTQLPQQAPKTPQHPSPTASTPRAQAPKTQEPGTAVQIAGELGVQPWQVKAAVDLLDAGSTVPFIARYRKE